MRLGCFLPLLTIGLIAIGTQRVYVSVTNRTPSAMTYREFLQKKPSRGWIEISDARLNLLSAISQSNRFSGTIKQVYIPVNSSAAGDGRGDGLIHLLLSTKDDAILQTMNDLQTLTGGRGGLFGRLKRRVEANTKHEADADAETRTPTPAADAGLQNGTHFMAENVDKLVISRPVRGLIQFGLDSDHRDRTRIRALDPKIAPDFAVLDDGAEPQFAGSVVMLIAGLGLATLLIARAAAKSGLSTSPPPLAAPDSPAPVVPPA
jgi:hypothetical protein